MKNFVLKKLELKNFKGQNRVFEPFADKTKVYAKNESGKTSLYKAFCWLLTSYTDSINVKNHELFDRRYELTPDTPKACVKATIEIDGLEYTIERRAVAKFTRKRSTNEWVKDTSDTYELYIDEIATSVSDFNAWLERNIGSTDLIMYALMGERFANLIQDDKRKGRAILESVSGEVKMEDMRGNYTLIADDLQKFTIDQLKERYKNTLKPLKERSVEIDSIVDAKEQELARYKETDYDALKKDIESKEKDVDDCDQSILDASKSFQPIVEEKKRILEQVSAIELDMRAKRSEYNAEQQSALNSIKNKIKDINAENERIIAENTKNLEARKYDERLIESEKCRLVLLKEQRNQLAQKRDEIKELVFTESKCASCGQELPFDQVEELREKFNANKNAQLENIVAQGKNVKKQIDECEERISELENILATPVQHIPLKSVEDLEKEYDEFKISQIPYEETRECKLLNEQINELKASIPNVELDTSEILTRKQSLMAELREMNRKYGEFAIMDRIAKEIVSLHEEKRELGNEIAHIECCIDKVREYEEEKANIVSERINDKLHDCKIVMYSRLKSGELTPDCVIVNTDGVPYATMNNSARLLACLSLQRMFCEHLGSELPIFVDEASVYDSSHLPKFDAQTIYLYASDDVYMRIE